MGGLDIIHPTRAAISCPTNHHRCLMELLRQPTSETYTGHPISFMAYPSTSCVRQNQKRHTGFITSGLSDSRHVVTPSSEAIPCRPDHTGRIRQDLRRTNSLSHRKHRLVGRLSIIQISPPSTHTQDIRINPRHTRPSN